MIDTDLEKMTTPQEMENNEPEGFFARLLKRFLAWTMLLCMITLVLGFVFFLGLALYRGIMWLWPW